MIHWSWNEKELKPHVNIILFSMAAENFSNLHTYYHTIVIIQSLIFTLSLMFDLEVRHFPKILDFSKITYYYVNGVYMAHLGKKSQTSELSLCC